MRWSVLLIAAVLAAGCKTAGGIKGDGPIRVSSNVANGFAEYKTKAKPLTFAVSVDGREYSYYYCTGTPCTSSHATPETIADCQGRSGGVPCKVFAIGREVVWNGPVTGLSGAPPTVGGSPATPGPSADSGRTDGTARPAAPDLTLPPLRPVTMPVTLRYSAFPKYTVRRHERMEFRAGSRRANATRTTVLTKRLQDWDGGLRAETVLLREEEERRLPDGEVERTTLGDGVNPWVRVTLEIADRRTAGDVHVDPNSQAFKEVRPLTEAETKALENAMRLATPQLPAQPVVDGDRIYAVESAGLLALVGVGAPDSSTYSSHVAGMTDYYGRPQVVGRFEGEMTVELDGIPVLMRYTGYEFFDLGTGTKTYYRAAATGISRTPGRDFEVESEEEWTTDLSGWPDPVADKTQAGAGARHAPTAAAAAVDRTPYDGTWTGEAKTDKGGCENRAVTLRVAAGGVDGDATDGGGTAVVSGAIDRMGNLFGQFTPPGSPTATIRGQLDQDIGVGSGIWKAPDCAGTFHLYRS